MKVYYVTKWALTAGILRVRADQAEVTDDGRHLRTSNLGSRTTVGSFFVDKKDWFESFPEAEARVEHLKKARYTALNKALAKLSQAVPIKDFE